MCTHIYVFKLGYMYIHYRKAAILFTIFSVTLSVMGVCVCSWAGGYTHARGKMCVCLHAYVMRSEGMYDLCVCARMLHF